MTTPGETTAATQQPIKKNRLGSKKRRKSQLASNEVETGEDQDTSFKPAGIFRQPPRGENRFVYLDPSQGKFGFRLQSYGRIREQGKVLQTFVQSVLPGSPSFMAGLYPGDAIIEVNGKDVKYAPVESVVGAIQEGAKGGERVALAVEFVDGVTRLEYMRKSDEFKNDIKTRQRRLEELRGSEESFQLSGSNLPSPQHITLAKQLPVWGESLPTFEATVKHKFPCNHQLNQIVAVHCGAINALDCDVLVMPISSCHKPNEGSEKNILLQLLRTGGPELLDELSLAKQCKIGENIVTWGHTLPAKHLYHCVFGNLEESLQSCCYQAMESTFTAKMRTIVFWLDGFASLAVSPMVIIDAVRNWMQQDMKRNMFDRVVFSSKANSRIVEEFMHEYFPLYLSASRDSGGSFMETQSQEGGTNTAQNETGSESLQNGTASELLQSGTNGAESDLVVHNGTHNRTELVQKESVQGGTGTLQQNNASLNSEKEVPGAQDLVSNGKLQDCLSTEDLLETLDAIQDENMKTFEELVGKLEEMTPEPSSDRLKSSQDFFSQSLPSHYHSSDFFSQEARSVSPSSKIKSQSGDYILNPGRTESDV